MSSDPHHAFDQTVLDLIEHNPNGSVPSTPSYQDALIRLYASHQIYASADHRDGHVTARSLVSSPAFFASNLDSLMAGSIQPEELESNASIYNRYVQSLSEAQKVKAETHRLTVAGRPAHHRKHGVEPQHDSVHSLLLVPGAGPHPGLPGNYLYGSALQLSTAADARWAIHLHDADDGLAIFEAATMSEVLAKLMDVVASAPFSMTELVELEFKMM